jgi:hypothetical protein
VTQKRTGETHISVSPVLLRSGIEGAYRQRMRVAGWAW